MWVNEEFVFVRLVFSSRNTEFIDWKREVNKCERTAFESRQQHFCRLRWSLAVGTKNSATIVFGIVMQMTMELRRMSLTSVQCAILP